MNMKGEEKQNSPIMVPRYLELQKDTSIRNSAKINNNNNINNNNSHNNKTNAMTEQRFHIIEESFLSLFFCNIVYLDLIYVWTGTSQYVQYSFIAIMAVLLIGDMLLTKRTTTTKQKLRNQYLNHHHLLHTKQQEREQESQIWSRSNIVLKANRTLFVVVCIVYVTVKSMEMDQNLPIILLFITPFLAFLIHHGTVKLMVICWLTIATYCLGIVVMIRLPGDQTIWTTWYLLVSLRPVSLLELLPVCILKFWMVFSLNVIKEQSHDKNILLDEIMQHLPAVLWITDRNLQLLFTRGQLMTQCGYWQGAFEAKTIYDVIKIGECQMKVPLDGDSESMGSLIIDSHMEALAGREANYVMKRDNGSIIKCSVAPLIIGNQRVGVIGIAQDVTELVKEKEARVAYEENFKCLVESIDETIIKIDSELRIQFINRDFLYKCRSDYMNTCFCDIFHYDANLEQEVRDKLASLFTARTPCSWEWSSPDSKSSPANCSAANAASNQNRRYFSTRAIPIIGSDRSVVAATVITSDITKKFKTEEQEKLEDHWNSMARIVHEIRNPLNGILGSLQLLQCTEPLTEIQVEHINDTNENAKLLLAILSDLLDMSKMEHNKLELQIEPSSVLDIVETVGNMISAQANVKGLSVHTYIDCNIPSLLLSDRHRISQILLNYSSNSIKFTNEGSIVLSALLEGEGPDYCDIRFQCRDSGIGIRDTDKSKIFRPFVQLPPNQQLYAEYQGWGLGLQICYKLAKLMNGTVGVESELGHGSTFYFCVRLPKVSSRTTGSSSTGTDNNTTTVNIPIAPTTRIRDDCKKSSYKNVVIVEQDTDLITILRSYLQTLKVINIHVTTLVSEVHQYLNYYTKTRRERIAIISSIKFKDMIIGCKSKSCRIIVLTKEIWEEANIISARIPVKFYRLMNSLRDADQIDSPSPSPIGQKTNNWNNTEGIGDSLEVLIVEDNPVNRKILAYMLRKMGITKIDVADNGLSGLQMVQRHERGYNIILMDLQMPIMNGFESAAEIRKLPNDIMSKTPIVALTATSLQLDDTLRRSFNNILTKPISIEQLQAMIRDVLSNKL